MGVLIGWGAVDANRAYFDRSSVDVLTAVMLALSSVFFIAHLVFDVLLLVGVRRSSTRPSSARRYLLSWLIFRAVLFGTISLGSFGLLITAIAMRYTDWQEIESAIMGGCFVFVAVISVLFWYAWVVVLSFYWQLGAADAGGTVYNRVQMETVPAGQPAPPQGEAASQVGGAGETSGQK